MIVTDGYIEILLSCLRNKLFEKPVTAGYYGTEIRNNIV